MSAANSGVDTLTTDNCAGCHRAHTAQGAYLLKSNEEDLCLTCHGTSGTGATANVEDGVQYDVAGNGSRGGSVVGALRGGGFVYARISSGANITRVPFPRDSSTGTTGVQLAVSFSSEVKVLGTGSATTSAHLEVGGAPGVNPTGVVWGNGAANSGIGPVVTLHCASCHNPHGNGAYRILNPIPSPDASSGTFTPAAQAIYVNEVRPDPTTGTTAQKTRNYTVQWGATLEDVIGAKAYPGTPASATLGDYWRLYQPYNVVPQGTGGDPPTAITNPANLYSGDIPEFIPAVGTITTSNARSSAASSGVGSSSRWRQQITAWCSTCHSRYNTQQPGAGSTAVTTTNPADLTSANLPGGVLGGPFPNGGSYNTDSGDAIYRYRHGTQNRQCTICHVAHGSNAVMDTDPTTAGAQGYAGNYPYPNSTISASSRLLKVNNRGTCQQCHDPTGTITWNSAPITH